MEKTIYVNRPASRTWNRLGGHGIDAAAVGCAAIRSLDAERGVFAGDGGEALA